MEESRSAVERGIFMQTARDWAENLHSIKLWVSAEGKALEDIITQEEKVWAEN